MVNELVELYDVLIEKDNDIAKITGLLGIEENPFFLDEASTKVEKLLIETLGGTESHLELIEEANLFYRYRNENMSSSELLEQIQKVVKNNL